MIQKRIFKLLSILLFLLSIAIDKSFAQSESAALAVADTSGFSVNQKDGWSLFNSYVNLYNADSVQMELIVQHGNNIEWREEHFLGTIKDAAFLPKTNQNILYHLLSDEFMLRIDTEGKCYLRLSSSSLPTKNPVVIPIKVYYKK